MEPIVNGLEAEHDGQIVVERRNANTEEGKALMTTYELRGHPSFVIVSPEAERLWSFAGFSTEEGLRSQIIRATQSGQ